MQAAKVSDRDSERPVRSRSQDSALALLAGALDEAARDGLGGIEESEDD